MTNDYVSVLVQQLKQSGQLEVILKHPAILEVLQQQQPTPLKYVIDDLSEDEVVFLRAYRAFLSDGAGNRYVGMASNFAKYLQSQVDKAKSQTQSTN